jgi:hypothetical protein
MQVDKRGEMVKKLTSYILIIMLVMYGIGLEEVVVYASKQGYVNQGKSTDLSSDEIKVRSIQNLNSLATQSNTTNVKINVPEKVNASENFTVQVDIENINDFTGGSVDLLYDHTIAQITGITAGNIFGEKESSAQEVINRYNNSTGVLQYCKILIMETQGVAGSGNFVNINFKAVKAGTFKLNITQNGTEKLSLQGNNMKILLPDSYSNPIPYTTTNVSCEIIQDNKPPTIESVMPVDGSENVKVNESITVNFNEKVKIVENSDGIVLKDSEGSVVQADLSIVDNVINIKPNTSLKYKMLYSVVIKAGEVEDLIGNKFASDYSFSFTTEALPDKEPPTVEANPKSGRYYQAQTVTLTASEESTIYYTTDGSIPDKNSIEYTTPIVVSANTVLKFIAIDKAGNQSDVCTESYLIDINAFFVKSTDPQSNSRDVSINKKAITVIFNSEITQNIDFEKITLTSSDGEPVRIKSEVDKNTLIISPEYSFKYNTQYKVTIPAGALKSTNGSILSENYEFSFTTKAENEQLVVIGTNPANNSVEVPLDTVLQITFNKNISLVWNDGTKNKLEGITLKTSYGVIVPINYTVQQNRLVVTPKDRLMANQRYELTISKNALWDLEKYKLERDYVLSFITQIEQQTINASDMFKETTQNEDKVVNEPNGIWIPNPKDNKKIMPKTQTIISR